MGLELAFRTLSQTLADLQKRTMELQEFVDCKPEYDDAAVAGDFSDRTLEMQGTIFEARRWAKKALQSIIGPPDLNEARRALGHCQDKFHQVEQIFAENLASYDKLRELARVRSRDPDWFSWGRTVKERVEECRVPLAQVSKALVLCWGELAERSSAINISVKTTGMIQNVAGGGQPAIREEEFHRGGP